MARSARARAGGFPIQALLFCLLLMGGGAVIAYMSTAETLDCSRTSGGRAACQLTRSFLGIPIVTPLGFVQGVEVKSSTDEREPGASSRQVSNSARSWVVFHTDTGTVDGVQGESLAEAEQTARALTAYLATPSQAIFTATITGGGLAHRLASWTFWGGAVLLALSVLGWLVPGLRPAGTARRA